MRLRNPRAPRLLLVGALLAAMSALVPQAPSAEALPAATFGCVPKFYQVTATGGGAFYEYNSSTNTMSRVGTGAVSGINSIGYNTADNYIYGLSGTKVYRLDATGSYDAGRTVTGLTGSFGGGDFYGGNLLVAPTSGNGWRAVDVVGASATDFTLTGAANGQAASGTWGAFDLTVQGNLAYGLNNQSLYIVKLDTRQVSVRTVTGATTGAYGAAYSDTSGNAFFYNNSDNKVFMLTAAELSTATGSATAPAAVLVGGAASTPALTAPNDGASCPNAVSPYVPSVDDTQTDATGVTETTATIAGQASANNTTTTLAFCYGTDPTLATCTTVGGSPATITGTTPTAFTAALTGLAPGTTYYYRTVATNSVGVNDGPIQQFTTPGSSGGGSGGGTPEVPLAQTITFAPIGDITYGDPSPTIAPTASSGLTVTSTSDTPTVCEVVGGAVLVLRAGTCTITATQAGDAIWAAAEPVSRTFTIAKAPQSVHIAPVDDLKVSQGPVHLAVTVDPDVAATFVSSTPSVCTVGDDGTVSLIAAGTCTITASLAGTDSYLADEDQVSFEVLPTLTVTQPDPVGANPGSPVQVDVPATGGVAPYAWALTPSQGNELPPGMTLDPQTGRVSGVVRRPGHYSFQITVSDSGGESVVRTLQIVVDSTLTGVAPSGERTVQAGDLVTLPDRSDDTVTWTYTLPPALMRVATRDGQLVLRAGADDSGVHTVPLTITDGETTLIGVFRITVLPPPITAGTYRVVPSVATHLQWTPRAGAVGYRVYVGGRMVGRTAEPRLATTSLLGPKADVVVRVEGHDGLLSAPQRLTYVVPTAITRAPVAAVVHFDTNRSDLDRADRAILDRLVRSVRSGGFRHARITGFTDARGTTGDNQGLSERRAKAVTDYLRKRLGHRSLSWTGRSENVPAASNATSAGRAKNRRVEVKVW